MLVITDDNTGMGREKLGRAIAAGRKKETQEELASRAGVSQSWWSKLEDGALPNPTPALVIRAAEAAGVNPRYALALLFDITPADLQSVSPAPQSRSVVEQIKLPPDISREEQAGIAEKVRRHVDAVVPVFVQEAREARTGDPTNVAVLPASDPPKVPRPQRTQG